MTISPENTTSRRTQQFLWIAATLIVTVIAVGVFFSAGDVMTTEAATARAWLDALCQHDLAGVYESSFVVNTVTLEDFTTRVQSYIDSQHLTFPCQGMIDLNLVRSVSIPLDLASRVANIRLYPDAALVGADGRVFPLTLWAYLDSESNEWGMYADFIAPTIEIPTEPTHAHQLIDSSGVLIGYATVTGDARAYVTEGALYIGVPISYQTLTRPWDGFSSGLLLENHRAEALVAADQLPPPLRQDFFPAEGGYLAQFLQLQGWTWYRFPGYTDYQPETPLLLTLFARSQYSPAALTAYFNVNASAAERLQWAANPVTELTLIGIREPDLVFETVIENTSDANLNIPCNAFIAVLNDDQWDSPEYCSFAPDQYRIMLAPGERVRAEVRFNGLTEDRVTGILYRIQDGDRLSSYPVWSAPTPP